MARPNLAAYGPVLVDHDTQIGYRFAASMLAVLAVQHITYENPALLANLNGTREAYDQAMGRTVSPDPEDPTPHARAAEEVYDAWNVEGPVPAYHRRMKRVIRRTWPALAGALDLLTAVHDGDPEPRQ